MRLLLAALIACAALSPVCHMQDAPPGRPPRGSPEQQSVDKRMRAALVWLADHQNREGFWSAGGFSADTVRMEAKKTNNAAWVAPGRTDGDVGSAENMHVAATSLAMLAFLGAGYDHMEGEFKVGMRNAVVYMKTIQRNTGLFGEEGKHSMVHDHAIATMAMAEAYGLSGDPLLKPMVEKAVEWLLAAQNPGKGWRYGVKPGDSDTQMTGWCVLALKCALMANLTFQHEPAYRGANAWLDSASGPVKGVTRTGYQKAGDTVKRPDATKAWPKHPDMDAVNILCRLFTHDAGGWDLKKPNKVLRGQVAEILKDLPVWEEKKVDFAYWYWATLALFQVGGKDWEKWGPAFTEALLKGQRGDFSAGAEDGRKTLDEHGSWDAVDVWHPLGGRVWSTAMGCLCLQVHSRYLRQQPPEKPDKAD